MGLKASNGVLTRQVDVEIKSDQNGIESTSVYQIINEIFRIKSDQNGIERVLESLELIAVFIDKIRPKWD